MLEKQIETYLRDQVKKKGGIAFKFVSPGNIGVPDRIVLLPGGRILFVETKAPGKKLSPLQAATKRAIEALGARYEVVDNKTKIDEILTT